MAKQINWGEEIKPLIAKYKDKKHPLDYGNIYQLVVMVVLSAQDSDKHINQIAPPFFEAFPDMASLAKADAEALYPLIGKVRNFGNKIKWLLELSAKVKEDKNIPLTMEELTSLPGIGRKSANVIMRESGISAEGIVVDLHVVRVVPRLGVVDSDDPKKIEKQLMAVMPQYTWGELGMAISFLGRETCRPTNPNCNECVMKPYCNYCKSL